MGLLFIFSGVVKANDPAGLGYKMQEFFEVWGWHGLDALALPLSLAMIAFEIVAGVAVIIGWRFPLFAWMLLALIVFFTFLTGYAVLSGKVRECGCFGDCIPLTAEQSFAKDLVLLALILLLFVRRRYVTALMSNRPSIMALTATTGLSLALQAHVLSHLPIVDCLPYRKGNDILRMMQMPEGAVPDSFEIRFVYQKAGAEVEFDADHFPTDFNDTAYTFLRRYDKLVRKGNAVPPISDFVIIAPSGEDTTRALLASPGRKLLVFSRNLPKDASQWTWADVLQNILQVAKTDSLPLI
ncbi:MAG: DoxX family protein, partial [Chitinophagia bacterium]|nr:DoxX family protein [Chitinophagia bacterium]